MITKTVKIGIVLLSVVSCVVTLYPQGTEGQLGEAMRVFIYLRQAGRGRLIVIVSESTET